MEKLVSGEKLGIYIHIPFCISKCLYCDFLSMPCTYEARKAYVETLCREIDAFSERYAQKYVAESVFFGGGTPSVLEDPLFEKIMNVINSRFTLADSAEMTVECNPGTVNPNKLGLYKSLGINRISFGLQSADNSELKALGRIHTFEDFCESCNDAYKAGFNNINVDIMMALPGQNLKKYRETLKKIMSFDIRHISAYSLIIEENTPFYQKQISGKLNLPSEDEEREMYHYTEEFLASRKFHRYEISNYAQEGYECRHNKIYWRRGNYAGFGLGAASMISDIRYRNTDDFDDYIKDYSTNRSMEVLSKTECMSEYMFLGLRMADGIDMDDFSRVFGVPIESVFGKSLEKHLNNGLLCKKNRRIYLSGRGTDIANYVSADFLLG